MNHCKWHGYFHVINSAGFTNENKAAVEGMYSGVCREGNSYFSSESLGTCRRSLDETELICEMCLDAAPTVETMAVEVESCDVYTADQARGYIATNIANWEA